MKHVQSLCLKNTSTKVLVILLLIIYKTDFARLCPVGSGTTQYCRCIDDGLNAWSPAAAMTAADQNGPKLQPPIASIITARRLQQNHFQHEALQPARTAAANAAVAGPSTENVMVLGGFSIRCERAPSMEAIRRELLMQTEKQAFNSLMMSSINISYVIRELFITKSRIGQLDHNSLRLVDTSPHPPRNDGRSIPMTVTIDALFHLYLFDNDLQFVSETALRPLAPSLRSLDFVEPHLRVVHEGAFIGLTRLETLNIVGTKIRRLPKLALLPNLKTINVVNSRLQSVKSDAFSHLPALETINLTNNQITMLYARGFNHLRSLIRLILRDNQIVTISPNYIEHTPQLQVLNMENNRLNTLQYDADVLNSSATIIDNIATSLVRLDLSGNQIWQLPSGLFNFMLRLAHLDLSNNTITAISTGALHNLPSLRVLDLSHNRLISSRALSICNAPSLQELDLGDNSLGPSLPDFLFCGEEGVQTAAADAAELPNVDANQLSSGLPRMARLSLTNNRLRELPSPNVLRAIPNLQLLDLSYNLLLENVTVQQQLNENLLWRLPALRTLNLAYNKISGRLGPRSLANHTQLHVLTLRSNYITALASEAFYNLPSLALLDAGHNQIAAMEDNALRNVQNLRHLLLPHNRLAQVSANMFQGLHALQTLDLSYNRIAQIRQVAFKQLQALELLDLSHNSVQKLNNVFRGARALQVVDLSYNSLSSIINDFSELPALRQLSLAHNNLAFVGATTNFVDVPQLTEIDLSYNVMPGLQLNVTSLQTLNVGYNKLDALTPDMLTWLPMLRELNVTGNAIKFFVQDALSRVPDLVSLDLSSNLLTTFVENPNESQQQQQQHRPFHNIELLHLRNNLLTSISVRAFRNMPFIRYVDMSANRITNVDFDASGMKAGPPSGIKLQNLTVIKLADNQITALEEMSFCAMPALRRLVLNNNTIKKIAPNAFCNLPALMEVNLNVNRLTEKSWSPVTAFDVVSASNLLFFHIAYNLHNQVPTPANNFPWSQHFPELLFMDLSSNNIDGPLDLSALVHDLGQSFSGVVPPKLSSLDTLNIAGNHIDGILLTPADAKDVYNQQNNIIVEDDTMHTSQSRSQYFSSLNWLDISNNELTHLPSSGLLRVFPSLEYLNLARNRLRTLRPSDLASSTTMVNPHDNRTSFASSYPPSNVRIKLHDNPWHCTCTKGAAWLQRWLRAQHVVDVVFPENSSEQRSEIVGPTSVSTREGFTGESDAALFSNNDIQSTSVTAVDQHRGKLEFSDGIVVGGANGQGSNTNNIVRCETPRMLRGTPLVFAQLKTDPNEALLAGGVARCIKIPGSSTSSRPPLPASTSLNDDANNQLRISSVANRVSSGSSACNLCSSASISQQKEEQTQSISPGRELGSKKLTAIFNHMLSTQVLVGGFLWLVCNIVWSRNTCY